jgi:hypothetical protein
VCGAAGSEQIAMMMTLVSSARRQDLDVGVYVKDVLDQLLAGSTDDHRRTTIACCPTSGSNTPRRRSAHTGSLSGATKPNASNSVRSAGVSPPVACASAAPAGPASRRDLVLVGAYCEIQKP